MNNFHYPMMPYSFTENEGEAIWYLGSLMIIKTSTEIIDGSFDLIDVFLGEGMGAPPHIHHREDESFYVLDGRITFRCGEQIIKAERGTFVFLPRGIVHSFCVEGTKTAHALEICSPGGFKNFFKEMGEPARERTLAPWQKLDRAKVRSVAPKYGIEIPDFVPDLTRES